MVEFHILNNGVGTPQSSGLKVFSFDLKIVQKLQIPNEKARARDLYLACVGRKGIYKETLVCLMF